MFFFALVALWVFYPASASQYKPDWPSLDRRPLPTWYDDAKLGIFMHWGLYSVPSHGSGVAWFWENWKGSHNPAQVDYMEKNFKPGFTYADFGPQFTAEFFNADRMAEIIKSSGAKYFVLTSKHHEGYTMWPSNYSWNWNSLDVGPNRDIVGELGKAILKVGGVKFGLYFSQFEWFNPLYNKDKANGYSTQEYVRTTSIPQMFEIINKYRPDILWSDGEWEAPPSYWNSTQFLAWLYNESPVKDTVVTNDRWGKGTACKHGGFWNCQDRYSPGHLMPHKWENCMTVDRASWGFSRSMDIARVLSIQELIETLASTISCGGNLLMNVGPTHDGRIVPIFEERLRQMGEWLRINGEAVYSSKPWVFQNDTRTPHIWYTSKLRNAGDVDQRRLYNEQQAKNTVVYAFVLRWPANDKLVLGAPTATSQTRVSMLGLGQLLHFARQPNGALVIDLRIAFDRLPSVYAWVLKLEYLATQRVVPDISFTASELTKSDKSDEI